MAENPHTVDVHVGSRIRLRRILVGWSQQNLGNAVGLTFQQVQKYETGINRVSASRLYQIANVLGVPVPFFFDDMPEQVTRHISGDPTRWADSFQADQFKQRETLEFIRAYYKIRNPVVREHILELIKSVTHG